MKRKNTPLLTIRKLALAGGLLGATAIAQSPAQFTTINPPIIPGVAPKVFWVSQPVRPDETVLISGGNFADDATVNVARACDAAPGSPLTPPAYPTTWVNFTPLQATTTSVKFVLPSKWLPGVYAFSVDTTESGNSDIGLINAPDIWWVQGDLGQSGSPGGWLRVQGTGIAILEGTSAWSPSVALVQNGAVVATLTASAILSDYSAEFPIPANLPTGTYDLYAHNGYGGGAAWTKYSTFNSAPVANITIANPPAWPTTVFDVSQMTGANADAKVASAIALAGSNQGGVIYFPTGTYTLTQNIVIPNDTLIKGDGSGVSTLSWPTILSATTSGNVSALIFAQGNCSMQDFAITSGTGWRKSAVLIQQNTDPVYARRLSVTLSQTDVNPQNGSDGGGGITGTLASNVEVTDCVLAGCLYGINNSDGNYWYIARNYVNPLTDGIGEGAQACSIVENNTFTIPGQFHDSSNGLSDYSHAYGKDLYFADNVLSSVDPGGDAGFTFDGNFGVYLGQPVSASGTAMTLLNTYTRTATQSIPAAAPWWTGAMVSIVGGKGMGQFRYLVNYDFDMTQSTWNVSVDHSWDICPDSSSVVAVSEMVGRVLVVGNQFQDSVWNYAFYMSSDVIFADNTVSTRSLAKGLYGACGGGTPTPGWRFQALGNQFPTGDFSLFSQTSALTSDEAWYQGPVMNANIWRRNIVPYSIPVSGTSSTLSAAASHTVMKDLVIEHNQVPHVSLYNPSVWTAADSIVRGNSWPWKTFDCYPASSTGTAGSIGEVGPIGVSSTSTSILVIPMHPDLWVPMLNGTGAGTEHAGTYVGTVGYAFVTGSASSSISALGFCDRNALGLATAHQVGIWDAYGNLMASATVPPGAGAAMLNGYRWVALPAALTLAPNTQFVVGASVDGGSDSWITCDSLQPGFTANQFPGFAFPATPGRIGTGFSDPASTNGSIYLGPNIATSMGVPLLLNSGGGGNPSSANQAGTIVGTIGFQFKTGATPFQLSALGFFNGVFNTDSMNSARGVFDGNPSGLNSSHQVGLWTTSGTLVATGTVPAGTAAPLMGAVRWVSLTTPVVLSPSTSYVLGATADTNGDAWIGAYSPNPPFTATDFADFTLPASNAGMTNNYSNNYDAGFSYPSFVQTSPRIGPNMALTPVPAAYTITDLSTAHGTVTSGTSASVSVAPGGNATFTITPASGFQISYVLVDGSYAGTGSSYTFGNISANHTIVAGFTALSADANLSALTLTSGTLAPAFLPAVNSYSVSVPYSATAIALTPTVEESHAVIYLNGSDPLASGSQTSMLPLSIGANSIAVAVHAQNGAVNTYAITVNRAAILDSLTSQPAAAFSFRKLRAAYTGQAFRVRRSSDNAQQDIPFTAGGDIDAASLSNFVGGASGYVTVWYDQSGNGNNVSESGTSYQPQIVASGTLTLLNGRLAARSAPTSWLGSPTGAAGGSSYTKSAVVDFDVKDNNYFFTTSGSAGANLINANSYYVRINNQNNGAGQVISTGSLTLGTTLLLTAEYDSGSTIGTLYQNQTLVKSNAQGACVGDSTIGLLGWTRGWPGGLNGRLSEAILFNSVIANSTERPTLEQSQSNYWVSAVNAPASVTNLTAATGNAQAQLAWTPPANNGGGVIVTYLAEYKLSSSSTWIPYESNFAGASLSVTGLVNTNSYDFRITPSTAAGTGTGTVIGGVYLPVTAPDAPGNVSAVTDNGLVTLTWTTPANTGGPGITIVSCYVEYKPTTSGTWTAMTGTPGANTTTITGLTNGTSYDFRVSAVSSAPTTSAPSAPLTCTPNCVIDSMTAQPTAAFGLRKLRGIYSGPAIRVRRSTDNAQQDIGFAATGDLDFVSLTSFVGAANGYVTVWYDQSASANNASESGTSYQPQIVTSGSLVLQNGRPAVKSTPTSWLGSATGAVGGSSYTKSAVVDFDVKDNNFFFTTSGTNGTNLITASSYFVRINNQNNGAGQVISTGSLTLGTSLLLTAEYNSTTQIGTLYQNQALVKSNTQGACVGDTSIALLGWTHGWPGGLNGKLCEAILFNTVLSGSDQAALERPQAAYWTTAANIPTAPTALTPTPASGQVTLAWQAPANNEGGVITNYLVEYKLSASSTWTTFANTYPGTSAVVTGLSNASAYDFRVTGINSAGVGTPSLITNILP